MRTYGEPAPPIGDPDRLSGRLIVIEGPDAVGRSTQMSLLAPWIEAQGHAVATIGLSRSTLTGPELDLAKQGQDLRPYPLALFYAADFFDQLESSVVPALRAGMVVLADRYVHTLIARGVVHGIDRERLEGVYAGALVPDATFLLQAKPKRLMERMLHKQGELDFRESGMDLGLSSDWTESFVKYQKKVQKAMDGLPEPYAFETINANRAVGTVQKELRRRLAGLLSAGSGEAEA